MAEEKVRKQGPSKRSGERKDIRLAPIYATSTFAERINAELAITGEDFAEFGRTAMEFYLEHKGAALPTQIIVEVDPATKEAVNALAKETRLRTPELLAENLLLSAIENGRDKTVEFIFSPTDKKLGISQIVDDRLNELDEANAQKTRKEAQQKEA